MRKLLYPGFIITLVAALFTSTNALAASLPFTDISGHWAENWIVALYDAGLTAGHPDGTYRPENPVTRAEMAVFLKKGIHGALYNPPTPNGSHPFSDIAGHWAEAWIETLYDEGLTSGFPDGTYRPEKSVSRAEMAVFLKKGAHGPGYFPPKTNGSHPFSDIAGHWAEAWIEDLFDEGFTEGYPDGTYRPENSVTRAEMAVFLVGVFLTFSSEGDINCVGGWLHQENFTWNEILLMAGTETPPDVFKPNSAEVLFTWRYKEDAEFSWSGLSVNPAELDWAIFGWIAIDPMGDVHSDQLTFPLQCP